jgi:sporulation protein YhbH
MTDNFKDIWGLKKPGARDSKRHRERIREAIKENLHELIAEENIISSSGKKQIKIPIRYLDSWRFKFGKNNKGKGVGHGEGNPGDIIARENAHGRGDKAGQEPGEDIYEEEVDIEELIELMLEDLDLPWLEEKEKSVEIETEETVFQDIAEKGLPANIDKRRTIMENLKRNALKGKMRIGGFELNDLRYKVWEQVIEKHSNASVILIMDRSGSMDSEKKFIVKSFFWWMVRFLEKKYSRVQLVFIAHDTEAREVEEENFFSIAESGGTVVSSGFKLAKQIVEDRFPTTIWNNYVFAFSDGDNWPDDNHKCLEYVKGLMPLCQAVGYGEVQYNDYFYNWSPQVTNTNDSQLMEEFTRDPELATNERFIVASIASREEVYECLKEFLKGVGGKRNG